MARPTTKSMSRITKGKRVQSQTDLKSAQQDREHMALARSWAKGDIIVVANPSLNRFAILADQDEGNSVDTENSQNTQSSSETGVRPMSHSISWDCTCITCIYAHKDRLSRLICQERQTFQRRRDQVATQNAEVVREKDAKIQELTDRVSVLEFRYCSALGRSMVNEEDADNLHDDITEILLPHIRKLEDYVFRLQRHIESLEQFGGNSYMELQESQERLAKVGELWNKKCGEHHSAIRLKDRDMTALMNTVESLYNQNKEHVLSARAAWCKAVNKNLEIAKLKQQLAEKERAIEEKDAKIKEQDDMIRKSHRN